jgi:hypothetical protein
MADIKRRVINHERAKPRAKDGSKVIFEETSSSRTLIKRKNLPVRKKLR